MAHSHFDTETRVVTCDLPSVNSDGSIYKGAPEDQRCPGAIEWCNSLYLFDWYETYGITSIAGTGVKTSLTETEVENYMAVIDATYPSLSTSRRQMIVLALKQVGSIGFWYGGKPFNTGWNAEWGQVAPSANPYYGNNTSYGHTILGLDAFGFAGWYYWSNYGIEPDFSFFGFLDSLNLVQTSSGNLLPGDVGLELIAGKTGNHIGIFAGYNDDGDILWIHCNDITGNVAINSTNVFRYYYRIEK